MLRRESDYHERQSQLNGVRPDDNPGDKYFRTYNLVKQWVESALEVYKTELKRLLWPMFVYCFLDCVEEYVPKEAERFFASYRKEFETEHSDDIRALSLLRYPEHTRVNDTAQIYLNNKYRVTLSTAAFSTLIQHIEANEIFGGTQALVTIQKYFNIVTVDRAASGEDRSLAKLLSQGADDDMPREDEGIPGHKPGSANTSSNAPDRLIKVNLGQLPMESDLMEDVKAELAAEDAANPPGPGRNTLLDEFEQRIKREPTDDAPSRDTLPLPPSLARNVAMEVQRVKENRDRFRIEGRTGGVAPALSVTMFTFHNTFDSLNCIEFSGDYTLVAVGTSESYIRIWSLTNQPLTSPVDPPTQQPSSSRRLIGHSGPVYALSFSPSLAIPQAEGGPDTRLLLSGSQDGSVRLWSLETFTCLVAYNGHASPVWDVRFSPHGHYFVSASADRTARMWSTDHISPLRLFVGHDSDAECAIWHPNSTYVFTGSGGVERNIRMWDVNRGTAVRLFTGHTGNITSLACSPNGRTLASGDDKGDIMIWDIGSGRLGKRLRGHGKGGIWSMDWCVEGTVLVSGGADGTVRVWDIQGAAPTDQGKVVAEGGQGTKVDSVGVNGVGIVGGGAATARKGKGKEAVVSPEQVSAFPTKKSPVYKVKFTESNLVMAGGAYLP
ncbi:Transcription initiation factor TFIID subunit 5 [Elasticomyces elasticus]|nr:Transcription initiation factor TFIID subunit 5 [Elasticomyces elasticus]